MAIFDAPTRALRCAFELVDAARGLDVETRAGIHTGRSSVARPASGASPSTSRRGCSVRRQSGQVVVTKTVRDLVTGTDLAFRAARRRPACAACRVEWELFEARTSDR